MIRGWEVCLKYLKSGWNRKEERGNKDFKKGGGGKLDQGMGALKGGGDWNPLMNYALNFHTVFQVFKVLKNLLDSLQLRFRHKF